MKNKTIIEQRFREAMSALDSASDLLRTDGNDMSAAAVKRIADDVCTLLIFLAASDDSVA